MMLFGLVFYVIYRLYVEGTPLTRRVQVPGGVASRSSRSEVEFSTILVRASAPSSMDDIVSTAGRMADAEVEKGERSPRLEVVYVAELPLTVPLDAPPAEGGAGAGGQGARPCPRDRG